MPKMCYPYFGMGTLSLVIVLIETVTLTVTVTLPSVYATVMSPMYVG